MAGIRFPSTRFQFKACCMFHSRSSFCNLDWAFLLILWLLLCSGTVQSGYNFLQMNWFELVTVTAWGIVSGNISIWLCKKLILHFVIFSVQFCLYFYDNYYFVMLVCRYAASVNKIVRFMILKANATMGVAVVFGGFLLIAVISSDTIEWMF